MPAGRCVSAEGQNDVVAVGNGGVVGGSGAVRACDCALGEFSEMRDTGGSVALEFGLPDGAVVHSYLETFEPGVRVAMWKELMDEPVLAEVLNVLIMRTEFVGVPVQMRLAVVRGRSCFYTDPRVPFDREPGRALFDDVVRYGRQVFGCALVSPVYTAVKRDVYPPGYCYLGGVAAPRRVHAACALREAPVAADARLFMRERLQYVSCGGEIHLTPGTDLPYRSVSEMGAFDRVGARMCGLVGGVLDPTCESCRSRLKVRVSNEVHGVPLVERAAVSDPIVTVGEVVGKCGVPGNPEAVAINYAKEAVQKAAVLGGDKATDASQACDVLRFVNLSGDVRGQVLSAVEPYMDKQRGVWAQVGCMAVVRDGAPKDLVHPLLVHRCGVGGAGPGHLALPNNTMWSFELEPGEGVEFVGGTYYAPVGRSAMICGHAEMRFKYLGRRSMLCMRTYSARGWVRLLHRVFRCCAASTVARVIDKSDAMVQYVVGGTMARMRPTDCDDEVSDARRLEWGDTPYQLCVGTAYRVSDERDLFLADLCFQGTVLSGGSKELGVGGLTLGPGVVAVVNPRKGHVGQSVAVTARQCYGAGTLPVIVALANDEYVLDDGGPSDSDSGWDSVEIYPPAYYRALDAGQPYLRIGTGAGSLS